MKKVALGLMMIVTQYSFAQITRKVGDFSSLKVYDKISVTIIPSSQNKIETDTEDVEAITKNGELKIRMTPARILQGDQVYVKVYNQKLNDIQASQGSSITSSEDWKSNMLTMTSNEGSKINLNIRTKKLNVKINSGGIIKVSGNAQNQDIIVNSGGHFQGQNLDSQNTTVAANAGGVAEVSASDSVNATTRAGGIIDVYGDPDDRKFKNVIGGKVNFK